MAVSVVTVHHAPSSRIQLRSSFLRYAMAPVLVVASVTQALAQSVSLFCGAVSGKQRVPQAIGHHFFDSSLI